jgi:hypothetical protein
MTTKQKYTVDVTFLAYASYEIEADNGIQAEDVAADMAQHEPIHFNSSTYVYTEIGDAMEITK